MTHFAVLVCLIACGRPAILAAQEEIANGSNEISAATQPIEGEEKLEQSLITQTEAEPPAEHQSVIPPISPASAEAVLQLGRSLRSAYLQFENGHPEKAGKLYDQFLSQLARSGLGPEVFSYVYGDLDRFLQSLNRIVQDQGQAIVSPPPAIPLDQDNEAVQKYVKAFTADGPSKERIRRAFERMGRYREMILSVLARYNLPRELLYLPVVESLYSNDDLSRAGALGLWQIMPLRARALNLKVNYWIDERKDPEKATVGAAEYLRDLYLMFDDWHLALSAYNRGEFGLGRDLKFSQATNISQMSERRAVPRETEQYVPQFIAVALIARDLEGNGFANLKYEQPVPFDEVSIDEVTDLKVAADCVHSDVATLRALNPAIRAWCTPHNYPGFILKIPRGAKEMFLNNIQLVENRNPSRGFIKYKVQRGEWLEKIAVKFGTSVRAIREDNNLKKNKPLRINQVLIIRPGRKYKSSGK